MNELSSRARSLIALASHEDDPSPIDQTRVGRALSAKLGLGVCAAAINLAFAGSHTKSTFGAVWAKWLSISVMGTTVGLLLGQSARVPENLRLTTRQPGAVVAAAELHQPAPVIVLTPPAPPGESTGKGDTSENLVVPRRATAAPGTTGAVSHRLVNSTQKHKSPESTPLNADSKSSGQPSVDPLLAETADLRKAQRALRSGRAAEAIALVDQQDQSYPIGALKQERAATRIFALCSLGQTAQALRLTREFARRWPRSPMLTRVQSSCGSSE